ncbi:MAG TPA: hypothetical protein VF712_13985 [Thermoleophilaceae bacterium]
MRTVALETQAWLACDFDALEVGMSLRTPSRRLTTADTVAWAALTNDRGPADDHEPAPQELLVLAYAVGLLPVDPRWVVAMRQLRDFAFESASSVDDVIRVETRVTGLRPLDERTGLVEADLAVVDESGLRLAGGSLIALWRRAIDGARA